MAKIKKNAQVAKDSSESAKEKEWQNKTFSTETMTRILKSVFKDEAKVGGGLGGNLAITFRYAHIEIGNIFGKWVVCNISSTFNGLSGYDDKTDKPTALFIAKNLTDVANVLDNGNWALSMYKVSESTGDVASMLKYYKTLLDWGVTADEIKGFNWFNDSHKYFANK